MKRVIKKIKQTINDMDKPLLFVTIALFTFGLLNIVTASSREAVVRYDAFLYHYFFQQVIMLAIGTIASIIIISIDSKRYRPFALLAYVIILGLLLWLLLFGTFHKGSKNWISLFGFSFQPSELAKPVLIVCLALMFEYFYRYLRKKGINHYNTIGKILLVGTAFPVIVFFQKDFGTMFILLMIFFVMFFTSPVIKIEKLKTLGLMILVGAFGALTLYAVKGEILSPAQLARFDFIKPCQKYEGTGYQICNGFIAIHDGGLLGLGIGKSKQKYSYIPEPHTDSVFAIIMEENGLLRSSLIFIAYLFILKRILNLASRANTIRGRYICLGVGVYIFMHILINLGGLFGVLPLTGVPLPFLSYGGSFTISLLCALALVQRIHIETKNQKITV